MRARNCWAAALSGALADWPLRREYARLPACLWREARPEPMPAPALLWLNDALARELGLERWLADADAAAGVLSGSRLPEAARPIAMAYAGHQFGAFTMLGDGRAVLLGEIECKGECKGGCLFDLHLKGSGRTPFSRGGDGRAPLAAMVREMLVCEAMHALGVPTTRALAVVATGERIVRRDGPEPGAVLARVAAGHVRVGTFEYAARFCAPDALRALADAVIRRHAPAAAACERPYLALLVDVIARQAALVAQWMCLGFVHGVMNTDNMSLAGETIDYGPCAWLDEYDPDAVFSGIDREGRYAFSNQPAIAGWNLARFAECLLPLIDPDRAQARRLAQQALDAFFPQYRAHWLDGMRRKLGLADAAADDATLIGELLDWMAARRCDYTLAFRELAGWLRGEEAGAFDDAGGRAWLGRWQERLAREGRAPEEIAAAMDRVNPLVVPRNHLVEAAARAAAEGDMQPALALLAALRAPFAAEADARFCRPPAPHERVHVTWCGT